MPNPARPPAASVSDPLRDALAAQIGVLRVMSAASRTAASLWPAACFVSSAPFFWAPPLWVLAMMAPSGHKANRRAGQTAGGPGGNAPR